MGLCFSLVRVYFPIYAISLRLASSMNKIKKKIKKVEGPQQKNDPTEVSENDRVDLLPSVVCAEPLSEKGTAKGEQCDCKTQGRCISKVGSGRQHQRVQVRCQECR